MSYPALSSPFKFAEANVRDNFGLIYELLEEVLDNGYPQSTDPDALKITTRDKSKRARLAKVLAGREGRVTPMDKAKTRAGGKTNREKTRNKPMSMIRAKGTEGMRVFSLRAVVAFCCVVLVFVLCVFLFILLSEASPRRTTRRPSRSFWASGPT